MAISIGKKPSTVWPLSGTIYFGLAFVQNLNSIDKFMSIGKIYHLHSTYFKRICHTSKHACNFNFLSPKRLFKGALKDIWYALKLVAFYASGGQNPWLLKKILLWAYHSSFNST